MTISRMALASAGIVLVLTGCVAEAQRFNWDDIGARFCQGAVAEDVAALGPILTPSLQRLIERAASHGTVPPRLMLQSYDAPATGCSVRTRNAGIVEVRRDRPGGTGWTDLLVMVPEPDGTTRIDDILFATRSTDTLRERLRLLIGPRL